VWAPIIFEIKTKFNFISIKAPYSDQKLCQSEDYMDYIMYKKLEMPMLMETM